MALNALYRVNIIWNNGLTSGTSHEDPKHIDHWIAETVRREKTASNLSPAAVVVCDSTGEHVRGWGGANVASCSDIEDTCRTTLNPLAAQTARDIEYAEFVNRR